MRIFVVQAGKARPLLRSENCPVDAFSPRLKDEVIQGKLTAALENRNPGAELRVFSGTAVIDQQDASRISGRDINVIDIRDFRALSPLEAREFYGRLLQDQFYRNQLHDGKLNEI
ncbi:hypothetical protein [Sphingomonas crusticola]|uniref:hypothetical protein n=1 Tax=Sphingomonas crusticola TaxID=1697973 RepID=UPI0013C2FE2D|nr:hypothetical protein [Sphingomonas crusticola]